MLRTDSAAVTRCVEWTGWPWGLRGRHGGCVRCRRLWTVLDELLLPFLSSSVMIIVMCVQSMYGDRKMNMDEEGRGVS